MTRNIWIGTTLSISIILIGTSALAAPYNSSSEAKYSDVTSSPYVVTPKFGFFNYNRTGINGSTVANDSATNPLFGVSGSWNFAEMMGNNSIPIYYGATTGLSFTKVSGAVDNGNLFIIPANLFLGYHITDQVAAAAHGGVNFFQQSNPAILGISQNDLKVVPNIGASGTWTFAPSIALNAELDWSLASGQSPIIGAVGLSFPLGG